MITPNIIFGISVLMSLLVWNTIGRKYQWFGTKDSDIKSVMQPILLLHSFRFIGLSFIVTGVVGAGLSPDWAVPAAWGDFAAAVLAFITVLLIRSKLFRVFAWAFSLVGSADLLLAFSHGNKYDIVGKLGATYFIITVIVPLLILTHITVFKLLLRKSKPAGH